LSIQDTRFVVLDTETTGLDPAEDKVVDISLVEVSRNGIQPLYSTLINPGRDISPTASAAHHITQRGVVGKPTFDEVWPIIMGHLDGAVIVAHNAQFDRSRFLKRVAHGFARTDWLVTCGRMHRDTATKFFVTGWICRWTLRPRTAQLVIHW